MNLTWHIVKKDIFGLRIPLVFWTLVMLGQVVIGERLFHEGNYDPAWFNRQGMLFLVLSVMDGLVCYFLVAALIKEDSPVGSRLFWVTHPISGTRLLRAKLIGIGIAFLLWPVLVLIPWWLANGFGWKEVGFAACQTMTLHLFIAFPALLLAVVIDSYGQFAVWTIVLVAAVCVVPGVIAITPPKAAVTIGELLKAHDLLRTRFWVSLAFLATTTVLVVWLQYRSRRRTRSVVLAGLGIGLSVLSVFFLPWSWSRPSLHVVDSIGTEHITAEFRSAGVENRNDKAELTVYFRFGNFPPDLQLLMGKAEIELHELDGSVERESGLLLTNFGKAPLSSRIFNLTPENPDSATEKKLNELRHEGGIWSAPHFEPTSEQKGDLPYAKTEFVFEPEVIDKILTRTSACTVTIEVTTSHPQVLFEVPLKEGASTTGDGLRLSVVKCADDEMSSGRRGPPTNSVVVVSSRSPMSLSPTLCVLDRVHGSRPVMSNFSMTRTAAVGGALQFERSDFHIPVPLLWRNEQWIIDRLPGYTLAAVRLRPEGVFARRITIDRLGYPKWNSDHTRIVGSVFVFPGKP
ncbi:MAG TPA: hypothetical protein VGM64_08885 [Lacunisphaera sp.]|jgi:hypothetical protein